MEEYFNTEGRVNRKEYLLSFLVNVVLTSGVVLLTTYFELHKFTLIAIFCCILHLSGLSIRRLHDIGKSGWWLLLGLFLAPIGLIFLMCKESQPQKNKWGEKTNDINI